MTHLGSVIIEEKVSLCRVLILRRSLFGLCDMPIENSQGRGLR